LAVSGVNQDRMWWTGLTSSKLRILVVGLDSKSTLVSLPGRPQASFARMRPSDNGFKASVGRGSPERPELPQEQATEVGIWFHS
jgi:hypothetical protein